MSEPAGLVVTTRALQAFRALERSPEPEWVDWAVRALEEGSDGPNLRILAGLRPPFNYFETTEIVDAALREVGAPQVTRDEAIAAYARELVQIVVASGGTARQALQELAEICIATDHPDDLMPFYSLHFAAEDLSCGLDQYYWDGADASNISDIITREAERWLSRRSTL